MNEGKGRWEKHPFSGVHRVTQTYTHRWSAQRRETDMIQFGYAVSIRRSVFILLFWSAARAGFKFGTLVLQGANSNHSAITFWPYFYIFKLKNQGLKDIKWPQDIFLKYFDWLRCVGTANKMSGERVWNIFGYLKSWWALFLFFLFSHNNLFLNSTQREIN